MRALSGRERHLAEMGLLPEISHELPELFAWLEQNKLTHQANSYDSTNEELAELSGLDPNAVATAHKTHRTKTMRLTAEELKELRKKHQQNGLSGITNDALFHAHKKQKDFIRQLNWERIPADAMAFYRPFHFPPFDQWGVYLLVEPLLEYHDRLIQLNSGLGLYSPEVLMHLIVFEVFNHEFFHHLVESTATTIEVLEAAQGRARPLYLDYKRNQFQKGGFGHPHQPLEEALANAYAYNSLGFISRIKAGFKTAQVKAYQSAIQRHWKFEPSGYRDADLYTGGSYIAGGATLLAQILGKSGAENTAPLSSVVKHVMPTGFSAFMAKPDIPVWLVGDRRALERFERLVPAPLEAYTQLFWPYDTSKFDKSLQDKLQEIKKQKQMLKQGGKQGQLPL